MAQELLAGIMEALEGMLRVLTDQGFAPLEAAYTASWLHTNQQVRPQEGCMMIEIRV